MCTTSSCNAMRKEAPPAYSTESYLTHGVSQEQGRPQTQQNFKLTGNGALSPPLSPIPSEAALSSRDFFNVIDIYKKDSDDGMEERCCFIEYYHSIEVSFNDTRHPHMRFI